LRPGIVQIDNGAEFAISDTNTTTTNSDGFDVLSGATFSTSGTITNGQYLQLRVISANTEFTPKTMVLGIGDTSTGSDWVVSTGQSLSTTPTSFVFPDVTDAIEDALIASASRPVGGITGLGTNIVVPVELVSTTSSEVKVKINNGSIGVFPASVSNGDVITLYARSSATFSSTVDVNIQVGGTTIPTWRVQTNSGPDTDASFTPPTNKTNQVPSTYISSSVITITGINRPITISATNNALISIDYDTAVVGPRTFDPLVNSSFYLILYSSTQLSGTVSTTVTVGTGTSNNPFTWSVTNYAVAPPPPSYVGSWYSKKNEKIIRNGNGDITSVQRTKYDGYSIGTILPALKEGPSGYGNLDGSLTSRFPGFIECDGSSYNAADYPLLWEVIGNTYGGNGSYDSVNKSYSGTFNVPDYRNRRMCGTGLVDGNRGSSAFLPVDGGSVFSVGSTGGFWFVDTVGVAGPLPYEQVEASSNSATTGTESPFFTLGTVRTTGVNLVTSEVSFTTTGTISAQVGPVSLVPTNAPPHSHIMLAAQVDGERGDPLIPWGTRALFATAAGPIDTGNNYAGEFPDESEATNAPGVWAQFLTNRFPEMASELQLAGSSMTELTDQLTTEGNTTVSYENLWPSNLSGLDTSKLITINNSGNREVAGVIDTNVSTYRIDDYGGSTSTHSHYITTSPITNPLTDYSYDNSSGAGTKNGLGDAANTLSISFNASGTGLGVNEGTFTMNATIKNPVPEVALSPNRTVPILAPFHKVKYIIKAY
jgi:microcystin-dependent protein